MTKCNRSGLSFTSSLTYILKGVEKRLNLTFRCSFRDTCEFCLSCLGFFFFLHPNSKFCCCCSKISFPVCAILGGMKSLDSVVLKYTGRMKYLIHIISGLCIWNGEIPLEENCNSCTLWLQRNFASAMRCSALK